ncbi:MAG: hypothetical protein GXO87_11790, partial [Chlorobi bacterium]|nr:hypothetical protein [Chlorobiota bacterium]
LNRTGLLEYDKILGDIIFYSGIVIFVLAFLAPLLMKNEKEEYVKLDLKL